MIIALMCTRVVFIKYIQLLKAYKDGSTCNKPGYIYEKLRCRELVELQGKSIATQTQSSYKCLNETGCSLHFAAGAIVVFHLLKKTLTIGNL